MSLFNWNGVRFPGFTMQQLNLDWILTEIKRVMGFFPEEGNTGTVLMKTDDGAAWEELPAIDININGVPEDTELTDTDKLIFYDVSSSANRKITAPNLLNSMMSNGTPLMDGTGSAGTSKKPARYDHRHPTDTSRQAALSGAQMNAVNSGAPANSFDSNGVLKFDNGGMNESASNYCKMPDGTLIEWGSTGGGGGQGTSASYPVTFAMDFMAAPMIAFGVYDDSAGNYDNISCSYVDISAHGFTARLSRVSTGYIGAVVRWVAIGRWK